MNTKTFFTFLLLVAVTVLTACGAGATGNAAPPAAPTATFNLADSADDIAGAWRNTGLNSGIRFNADGTYSWARRLADLDSAPNVKGEFRFDGTKLLFERGEATGVPPCEDTSVPVYEVRLLASGNIWLVAVDDKCPRRSGSFSLEFEPVTEASAASQTDPASVLQAFFAARNASDVDGAMKFVADDAVFTTFSAVDTGTEQIRAYIQARVDNGTQFEITNVQATGDTVTWNFRALRNSALVREGEGEATIQDGKIRAFTLK